MMFCDVSVTSLKQTWPNHNVFFQVFHKTSWPKKTKASTNASVNGFVKKNSVILCQTGRNMLDISTMSIGLSTITTRGHMISLLPVGRSIWHIITHTKKCQKVCIMNSVWKSRHMNWAVVDLMWFEFHKEQYNKIYQAFGRKVGWRKRRRADVYSVVWFLGQALVSQFVGSKN